jgi:hypothetical protein
VLSTYILYRMAYMLCCYLSLIGYLETKRPGMRFGCAECVALQQHHGCVCLQDMVLWLCSSTRYALSQCIPAAPVEARVCCLMLGRISYCLCMRTCRHKGLVSGV